VRGTNLLLSLIAGLLGAIVIVLVRADLGRANTSVRAPKPKLWQEQERSAPGQDDGVEQLSQNVEALRKSVERLTAALEEARLVAESRPRGVGEAIVVDRGAVDAKPGAARTKSELESAIKAEPDPERRKALDGMRAEDDDVVNRRHWFMTIEEAIQRYGPPDDIVPDAGGKLMLEYRTELAEFTFQFFDGRVLRVYRSDK
jgi:hypothetical protein